MAIPLVWNRYCYHNLSAVLSWRTLRIHGTRGCRLPRMTNHIYHSLMEALDDGDDLLGPLKLVLLCVSVSRRFASADVTLASVCYSF